MLREEKKFVLTSHQLRLDIRDHISGKGFQQGLSYKVYSVYYDFYNFSNAVEHLEGNFLRRKYRLRFYTNNDGFLINGFFWEEKIKKGSIGSKKRYRISEFDRFLGFKITNEVDLLSFTSKLVSEISEVDRMQALLNPLRSVVLIGYFRTRFNSLFEEANIDESIEYSVCHNDSFGQPVTTDSSVLEVKTPLLVGTMLIPALDSDMPVPRTRFSKYLFALSELGVLVDY